MADPTAAEVQAEEDRLVALLEGAVAAERESVGSDDHPAKLAARDGIMQQLADHRRFWRAAGEYAAATAPGHPGSRFGVRIQNDSEV